MRRLILCRLATLPLVLLAIFTITLALSWAVPGNPLENPEGRQPRPAVAEAMKRQYNLDSFWRFYFSYLDSATGLKWARESLNGTAATQAVRANTLGLAPAPRPIFDLGPALKYEDWRVNEIIAGSLPISATLGAMAILIALAIGLAAGVIGAARPGSALDAATFTLALVGISLPSFVIGSALLLLLGLWIPIARVGGLQSPADLLLPAFTLSLPFAAYIARLTRMGMIEALQADYIRTARAKGLRERTVLLKHALKNAFLPVLSYLGPATAAAMTGSFVVERVFNVPGLGQHFVNAVQNKDLFLIIGVVLVFSTMLILFNLAVDVLYSWFDPRIQ
jgi:oligopeptide transport system permease protein